MDDEGNGESDHTDTATVAKFTALLPIPRSEGQRLLLASSFGVREAAQRLGWAPSTVSRLRTGERQPSPEYREAMARVLGIPVAAWDKAPAGSPKPSVSSGSSDRADGGESMIDQARGQLALAIEDAESAESIDVRTKARSQVVAIMRTINDMEKRAEDLEGRAVRSSNFLGRVVAAVLEAVKGHPEVSERLERSLEDLDLRKDEAA